CEKMAAAADPSPSGTVHASPPRSRTTRTPLERRRDMEAAIPLGPVPREERPRAKEPYTALLGRLSHQSVVKHFDAYADVDWERQEHRIDPEDPRWELGDDVLVAARRFPALFFIFVLGGEDPIDHVQRTELVSGRPLHPLLERIMRIHVTEEARHLSFARHYLRAHVPLLTPAARARLALQAPLILGPMAQLMMRPSAEIVRTYRIPGEVVAEAYTRNPHHRAKTVEALGKVRDLCR